MLWKLKTKSNNEVNQGLLYGGVAIFVLSLIILIENTEAFPFSIVLFVASGLMIFFSFWLGRKNK